MTFIFSRSRCFLFAEAEAADGDARGASITMRVRGRDSAVHSECTGCYALHGASAREMRSIARGLSLLLPAVSPALSVGEPHARFPLFGELFIKRQRRARIVHG